MQGSNSQRTHELRIGAGRSIMTKPRVAGSNPAGRATFLKNSPIIPSAWAPGAKVQAKKVTGQASEDWLTEVRPAPPPCLHDDPVPMAWCVVVEPRTLRECRIALGQSQAAFAAMLGVVSRVVPDVGCRAAGDAV